MHSYQRTLTVHIECAFCGTPNGGTQRPPPVNVQSPPCPMTTEDHMTQLNVGRWRLNCDREATQRAYKAIEIGGPEACGCSHCRNFVMVRDHVYPSDVRSLFEDLGIESCREREVYHMVQLKPGMHLYGGWLHCVGWIEGASDEFGRFDLEVSGDAAPFTFYFHDRPTLLPDSFQGLPTLQFEFTAQVPWVIQETEPE